MMDDMSIKTLELDMGLLESTTVSLFVQDSIQSQESLDTIKTFAHAAMQTEKAALSDILKVLRQKGSQEAEEILKAAEENRVAQEQAAMDKKIEADSIDKQKTRDWEREKIELEHENEMEQIREKGKIDIRKQAMLSVGFNEDKDVDNDGTLDVLELRS